MAHEIRYPVALKIGSRDIPHVTDASAIKLNVKSDEEFKNAYDYVVSNSRAYDPNAKLEGVYVQKMVSKGAEVDHRGIERRIVLNHSFYLELEEFSLRSYGIHR